MEDKSQLKIFTGIGEDSINKEVSKELLEKVQEEQTDKAKERLLELERENENLRKAFYLDAYNRLEQKYKDKISEKDIEDLLKGKKLSGEAIEAFQNEREKLFEERDNKLFNDIFKGLGKDMSENQKLWNKLKRQILVGVLFGIPGLLFITVKDLIDEQFAKKELSKGITKNDNPNKMNEAEKYVEQKFGKITRVPDLINHLKSSDIFQELRENENSLREVIAYKNSKIEELTQEFEELIEDENQEDEKQEEQKAKEEEEEDEEDPEPVEGMKYM